MIENRELYHFADLGVDDTMLDSMEFESEQLSNASVYHANFEKIKVSCKQNLPCQGRGG